MLRVRVLGDLEVELDGTVAALPSSAKVRAVLAWLALHPGMQPRSTVAARLWPDVLDASARASLRSAVWALRRALGDHGGRLLAATRDHVGLGSAGIDLWVDLLEFERLARAGRPEEALALDADQVLAGIDEEWVYAVRDEHDERRMRTLAAAANAAEARGDLAGAIAFDRRRAQLDPLSEPAHRDLIRRLDAVGDRGAALAAYARLRDRMRRDLSLSPSPATRAAMEAVRAADADDGGAEALPLVGGDERSHAGRPQRGESEPRPADDRAAGGIAGRVVGAAGARGDGAPAEARGARGEGTPAEAKAAGGDGAAAEARGARGEGTPAAAKGAGGDGAPAEARGARGEGTPAEAKAAGGDGAPAEARGAGGDGTPVAERTPGAADVEAADHAPRAAADRASRLQPLAGREGELGALLDAWELARAGGGGAVVLEGEGGIGKTRIALELLARAERSGAATAACAALELGGAAPFGLWAELLGELARTLAPARPPPDAVWPEDLGRLSPAVARRVRAAGTGRRAERVPAASPEFERARLFEAVVEMLVWAAGERPLVLLMEDIHLADRASLELVGHVAHRLPELPVLLVLTRRDAPRRAAADLLRQALDRRGVLRAELELAPLRPDALAELVRSIAPLAPQEVGRVVAASEGNALLAVEVARAAAARPPGSVGPKAPPPGLRALVRAATAPLSPDARAVADFAAVAGRELAREELLALPVEEPAAAAETALESGLLIARDGRLGFRHALLRAAAYDDLPEPRRAALHERLAGALEAAGRAPAAELGRHLRLAGRDAAAVPQLRRAGLDARAVGALAEAAAFFGEALEIRPGDPGLLLELGDVMAWRNDWDAADAAFAQALAGLALGDLEGRARAHARRGLWFRTSLCAPERSAAEYREALGLIERLPSPKDLLVEVLAGLAWAEGAGGDPDETDRLLRRVRQVTQGELPIAMVALVNSARGMALCRRGRFAESYGPMLAAADAHARAGALDEACVALSNAGCAAAFEHDFERALDYADRAVPYSAGAVGLEAHILAARAYVLSRLGRHEEARAAAELQCARTEQAGATRLLATARHDLGRVALAAGDWATAATRIGEALADDAAVPRAVARLARAEALARLGRAGEAQAELRAATLEPVTPGDFPATLVPRLARVQGLVALARGDRARAAAHLREAADGWRRQLAAGERGAYRVDMGRPPVSGLVEPDRELAQIERDLAKLQTVPA